MLDRLLDRLEVYGGLQFRAEDRYHAAVDRYNDLVSGGVTGPDVQAAWVAYQESKRGLVNIQREIAGLRQRIHDEVEAEIRKVRAQIHDETGG